MFALFVNIVINFFECIIAYYLCHNLIDKKVKLTTKTITLGVLYGIIIGILATVISGYTFRVLITIVMFLIIKLVAKKKIHDIFIIYGIIYLCLTFVQIPSFIIINILRIHPSYTFLLAQTLTLFVIIFLYIKFPFYKLLNAVEKEILLKLFIFIITSVALIMFIYINLEFTSSFFFYFSLLIIVTFIGLYQTLTSIFFYTNKVPTQLHDVKNLLMGMYISAYSTTDINRLRNEINECLEIIGMDTNVENIYIEEHNKNILSFINQKKYKSTKPLTILTDICYYESNPKVHVSSIIYMLGVLLDNAIESGTRKAILINLRVAEERVSISVSNEYKRKSMDDFNKMFQKKYSTKSSDLRGYGLPNLSKVVNNYGGDILVNYEYNTEQKSNYLTIILEIKN